MLENFVKDITVEHLEELIWEEAFHSCRLDGIYVEREDLEKIKQIAAQREKYKNGIVEKILSGKYSDTQVKKILTDFTRNSLEGIDPNWAQVIRYYEVASSMYALTLEEGRNIFGWLGLLPKIIHASLFYGIPGMSNVGQYRKGKPKERLGYADVDYMLTDDSLLSPPMSYIEEWMNFWAMYTVVVTNRWTLDVTEHSHALFMSIIPFEYGNGRVGRLLMNVILLSNRFANAVIPSEGKEKEMYLEGLDRGATFFWSFTDTHPTYVLEDFKMPLIAKFYDSRRSGHLIKSIAYCVMDSYDKLLTKFLEDKLIPLKEFEKQLGKKASSVRNMLDTRKLIRKKKNKEWFVYPEVSPG
ncbi:Fic family protein [Fervidobacterium pennivorans subsp. shakshaketiis]|uniref:Fic family protein n=1 Tax=Fervidobacterium pennivorans TaxID=93466 RepID=UPI001436B2EC|nr:Fic family protein [Fervidobacterium pennivorans subsp. keratinolyticus]